MALLSERNPRHPVIVDNRLACQYDPLGRMSNACENASVTLSYDGDNVVRTKTDSLSGALSFVDGPGLDDPLFAADPTDGYYYYFLTDGQGRQYAVGDTLGADMSGSNGYFRPNTGGKYAGGTTSATSFGATRDSNPQAAGLSFFRNRFYDQVTGRWTQEDPVGLAGGMNLYAYAGNNPTTYTDPFGLCPKGAPEGAVCVDFFIKQQNVWGFKGDNRGHDPNAPASQSRAQLVVDTHNPRNSYYIVSPSCFQGHCSAPSKSNSVTLTTGQGGSLTVSFTLKNSAAPLGMAEPITGSITLTPGGSGSYTAHGSASAFPSSDIFQMTNGSWHSIAPPHDQTSGPFGPLGLFSHYTF